MTELVFDCIDARADRYAAVPTLQLQAADRGDHRRAQVHAIALRCQIRIEPPAAPLQPTSEADGLARPVRRAGPLGRHAQADAVRHRLADGARLHRQRRDRPAGALHLRLRGGRLQVLPRPRATARSRCCCCSAARCSPRARSGFAVEQVPWHKEARYRLPVAVWREMMDRYFPGQRLDPAAPRHARRAAALQGRPGPADLGRRPGRRCSTRPGRPAVSAPIRRFELRPQGRRRRPLRGLPALPLPGLGGRRTRPRWQFGVLVPPAVERARPRRALVDPDRVPARAARTPTVVRVLAAVPARAGPDGRGGRRRGRDLRRGRRARRSTAPSWSPGTRPSSRRSTSRSPLAAAAGRRAGHAVRAARRGRRGRARPHRGRPAGRADGAPPLAGRWARSGCRAERARRALRPGPAAPSGSRTPAPGHEPGRRPGRGAAPLAGRRPPPARRRRRARSCPLLDPPEWAKPAVAACAQRAHLAGAGRRRGPARRRCCPRRSSSTTTRRSPRRARATCSTPPRSTRS